MSIKDNYHIRPVDFYTAMYYVERFHYLHRKCQASYSYGLFEVVEGKLGEMVGVITYGKPASPSLCDAVCGKEESGQVMELTRLWTSDNTPKNTESFLIANTLPMVQEDIIVTYADSEQDHYGFVYQATNFLYTGRGAGGTSWQIEGSNKHTRHLLDEYDSVADAKKELGDKLKKVKNSEKYRYVFFNCNKRRKRELKKKLKYPILPYPKPDIKDD